MLTRSRFIPLAMLLAIVAMIAAVACGSETVEVTRVVEVEREVEVPVTQVVTERVEVPVTQIVMEEVEVQVTKEVEVEVEVTKVVVETETVVEEKEVEVTKIVEVEVEAMEGPKETIVFSDLNWTSAQVQNRVAQYIVEHGYGYPTDLVFGGTLPLFEGLRKGDTHVTMEIWLPNQEIGWNEALEQGTVVSVGTSLVGDWQSTFVIPAYIAEQYPDLKTPEDLKKPEFQELFATDDSRGKARLVACVPGWSCELVNDEQIESYGLTDYLHVIKPGSQDAMFSEIFGAYERQEPWLGYMWGTGDPAIKLDLVLLEEEPYSDECWASGKMCHFADSLVLIAVHNSLLPRAPDVVGFLQNWDFGVPAYNKVFLWSSENEATPEETAIYWLENNRDTWMSWVTEDAREKVAAALDGGVTTAEGWPEN